MTIRASKFYGAGLHNLVRSTLMNSFTLITLLTLIQAFCTILYGTRILVWCGLEEILARDCTTLLIKLLPVEILIQYTKILNSYLVSLGENISGYDFMIIASLIMMLVGYLLLLFTSLGFWSYIITTITIQLIMFSVVLYLFVAKIEPKYRHFSDFGGSSRSLGGYLVDFVLFFIGTFGDSLGWEMAVYFAILTKDNDQIAAMTYIVNLACYICNFTRGPSSVAQAIVNTLIGAKCKRAAKKYTIVFLVGMAALGVLIGIGVHLCARQIAEIFIVSSNHNLLSLSTRAFRLYSFWIPQDLIFIGIMTAARSAGLATLSIILNILFPVVGQIAFALWLKSAGRLYWSAILINAYVMFFIMFTIIVVILACMDWTKIPDTPEIHEERQQENHIILESQGDIHEGIRKGEELQEQKI